VPRASIPKTHQDLLKPEWKANIGIDTRAYEWFGTMLKAMGEEKGVVYMRDWPNRSACAMGGRSWRNWLPP
jgi:ABC-type Fe3+ transport system substrate-binding protein